MKLLSLLLLSLAIVACAPPYSAELNSAAPLARQMTLLGTLGAVNSPDGDSTTSIKFLPIKPTSTATTIAQLNVGSGFLVSRTPGREGLSFALQSGGKVQTSNIGASFSLSGADPNYPLNEYDVIDTTTTANIVVLHMDGTTSGSFYQLFTADLGNGSLMGAAQNPLGPVYGSQTPLAVQDLPILAADKFNFLFTNGSTWSEVDASLSGSSFGTGVILRTVTLPSGIHRMLYYRRADNTLSYFGYNSGGQWIWSRYDGSTSNPLSSVTHRIDALLSNGDLLSTEGGTLRIYDSGGTGTQVSSVQLDALQFCYEAWVGPTAYVFFSLTLGFPHNSWAFQVYAIPTSSLRGLKG